MPRIPFSISTLPFVTELGNPIPARRPFVRTDFIGPGGKRIAYPAFFDTGSPYSVVPQSLALQLTWNRLGAQAILGGTATPIEWQGLPCVMAELEVDLVDDLRQLRTRPLRMLAKIPNQPAPPHLEYAAVLGMAFLWDNGIRLGLDGGQLPGSGYLWIP